MRDAGFDANTRTRGKSHGLDLSPHPNLQQLLLNLFLRLDDLILDGVAHKLTHRVNFQLAHDIGAMRLGGFHADS
jgi:hypothetical protein